MSVQNRKITNDNLLQAVVDLPKREFEKLIANARKLRSKSSENQAKKEIRLIKKVNESIHSDSDQKRLLELIQKRRDEIISENELNELLVLTEKDEELNAKRLKYLFEIAKIRNKSLREVMKDLEIAPPQTI